MERVYPSRYGLARGTNGLQLLPDLPAWAQKDIIPIYIVFSRYRYIIHVIKRMLPHGDMSQSVRQILVKVGRVDVYSLYVYSA